MYLSSGRLSGRRVYATGRENIVSGLMVLYSVGFVGLLPVFFSGALAVWFWWGVARLVLLGLYLVGYYGFARGLGGLAQPVRERARIFSCSQTFVRELK